MLYGISGASLPSTFPFAAEINGTSVFCGASPCLVGGIAYVETLSVLSPDDARTYVSFDNGHGLFQLTSSWPQNWQAVTTATQFAIENFVVPAMTLWNHDYGYTGDTLVRCVAATYNAGLTNALKGHFQGNVGKYTTQSEGITYDIRVLNAYKTLASGALPPLPA